MKMILQQVFAKVKLRFGVDGCIIAQTTVYTTLQHNSYIFLNGLSIHDLLGWGDASILD